MKKTSTPKKSPVKKADKAKDSGELRKPATLKPIKEKEKKNWKNNLEDDDSEDFNVDDDDDLKADTGFDEEEDEDFFDDRF